MEASDPQQLRGGSVGQEPKQELEEEMVNESCFPALSQAHAVLASLYSPGNGDAHCGLGPLPSDNSQNVL